MKAEPAERSDRLQRDGLERAILTCVTAGPGARLQPGSRRGRDRGTALRLDLGQPPPLAHADPHQLQRVLLNLWRNAVQAIEERAPPDGGTIRLTTWSDGGLAILEVADDGNGITAEDRARIFTPFFTTRRRGTGLGLAVVKKIVDDHRGTIDIESQPGVGTTVRLRLAAGG